MQARETIIKLESLLDLSARLTSAESRDFIINAALLTLMGKLRITRACALEKNGDNFTVINKKGNIKIEKIPYFTIQDSISSHENEDAKLLLDEGLLILLPMNLEKNEIILCLGSRNLDELAEDETKYAFLVCNIASNAVKNVANMLSIKEEKARAEKQNQLLSTMFEIRKDFSNLHSREQLLKMLSLNLMGQLTVTKFAAVSVDDKNNNHILINRFNSKFSQDELLKFADFSNTLCVEHKSHDGITKDLFDSHGAVVLTSAQVQGTKKGYLLVGRKMNGDNFTDDNVKFIHALGNTFFSELENERLFREEIEKKRLESEIALALEIQKNLLPKKAPNLPGFDIYGRTIPSRYVGGDYFDFIRLDEHRLLFVVADVSGKGIPASLIMANVQAALRSLTPLNIELREIVKNINRLLFSNTASDKFVTAFFGIIDSASRVMTYINAGHNPPYHLGNGQLNTLNEGGLLLGIMPEAPEYEIGELKLNSGDLVYVFSDGVTESKSLSNDEYGEEKLENLLREIELHPAIEIVGDVFDSVYEFSDGAGQYDDLTAIAIKCE